MLIKYITLITCRPGCGWLNYFSVYSSPSCEGQMETFSHY